MRWSVKKNKEGDVQERLAFALFHRPVHLRYKDGTFSNKKETIWLEWYWIREMWKEPDDNFYFGWQTVKEWVDVDT